MAPPSTAGGVRRSRAHNRWPAWAQRALWVALAFTAGPVVGRALDGVDVPLRTAASLALWAGWAAGVVAAFLLHPLALTALRAVSPLVVVGVGIAALEDGTAGTVPALVASASALLAAGCAFSEPVGTLWVNGPAYPNERRFLLRRPGPGMGGGLAVGLTWALGVAALATGPSLLASGRWWSGAAATVAGLPVVVLVARSLHNLARRWVVLVPAGLVLHDPVALVDPVLFPRQSITVLQAAGDERDGLDVTLRAPGPALRMRLTEPVEVTLMRPGHRLGRKVETSVLLFSPVRPGAVLQQAGRQRIPTAAGGR